MLYPGAKTKIQHRLTLRPPVQPEDFTAFENPQQKKQNPEPQIAHKLLQTGTPLAEGILGKAVFWRDRQVPRDPERPN